MTLTRGKWALVVIFIILAVLAIFAVGVVANVSGLITDKFRVPEIILTVLLISGVATLLTSFLIIVAVFAALGLSDRTQAFGMPEGTIRAVIALMLILIFSITSVFLYGQLRSVETRDLVGLTAAQLAAIPGNEIVANSPDSTNSALFNVSRRIAQSEASSDAAKQILTSMSTLVVAVAGFYFGARSVETARMEAPTPSPVIRGIKPPEGKQGEELDNVEIQGRNFISPKSVSLIRGAAEILFEVKQAKDRMIIGSLKISQTQPVGLYELVVMNQDGGEDRLPDAFEVK